MLTSMTGIAALSGSTGPYDWSIELRGVNNKGLDIRARVPDWLVGLDQLIRKSISASITRGSLQFALKVSLSEELSGRKINMEKLNTILDDAAIVAEQAAKKGLSIAPISLADIASQNGFTDFETNEETKDAVTTAIIAQLPKLIEDFQIARKSEGFALHQILLNGVLEMERLLAASSLVIVTRTADFKASFEASIQRLKQEIDPERLAQEMAILAIKNDVAEEIDRLTAHINAARGLLNSEDPVGRKFDFLMQEFNREANTLCAKSGSKELTAFGIEMKVTIDQMREQVQNVE